nr:reverse transcriptase domain-containing protein [Tanacetum cinerariifolium]
MRYSSTCDDTSGNRVDVIDIACEDFVQDVLDFQYNPKSSSPTLVSDDLSDACKVPIVKSSSPTLTPFGESDFFLEEIENFLNDDSIPIENYVFDPEGDILLIEKLLNEDPCQLPPMDLKVAEVLKEKSSIEEPPELELKELPSHLEYAFLEDSNKLPVIIAKNLKADEREALINVLKSHTWTIAWKISNIKGIDLRFYTHKISMEDEYKPAVQSQRRVNPKIHDVIKKEVINLLDAGIIYPIFDSPWVSPIHCVPKKGGYFQIPIDPQDQEKTTFTCPYGTFTYRRMPFGLCNAPEADVKFFVPSLEAECQSLEHGRCCIQIESLFIHANNKLAVRRIRGTGIRRIGRQVMEKVVRSMMLTILFILMYRKLSNFSKLEKRMSCMVRRQRIIYSLLNDELQNGLHALSIEAKTPADVCELPKAGYGVVAPNYRGYGLLDTPVERDYIFFVDLVEDTGSILDHLNISKNSVEEDDNVEGSFVGIENAFEESYIEVDDTGWGVNGDINSEITIFGSVEGLAEESKEKSSVEEPPELELKEFPSHLEYAFLEDSNKLPVIIAKNLKVDEREALLNLLKSHKRAIVWKIFDIKGIDPSLWVSPIHCVPKKGGMTVVASENNELIPTRLVTGCRVCIDYRKLNDATRKDHFPLPFMDQMLERLAGNELYCFLDGFSGYFQIPIDPQDQEKTTFTCLYGTFAYRRLPFGLCNAPGTFQMCMMSIFHDMIEKIMEVFMDDFSVFGDNFSSCLTNLDKMLNCCEETNLVLNWENCHFMCREGIVLGDKISKSGIEVDRAKVDVIAKLPHQTTVKGVRSFLGHAGFYRHFIQDFSKIARPMTRLLEKDTPFVFSKECIEAFNTLKKKLTEAPILVVPDWNLPFELMCDASDYAIGAVLGQRKSKHFQPIHYASKTMTEDQIHYTTTEKEMLAVVYAFKKLRSYFVLSTSIVYTDHSALKYLLNKQDAKPRKLLRSSKLAMRDLPEAIMVPISQRRRGKEKYLKEMRCLRTVFKFVRYSIFGV